MAWGCFSFILHFLRLFGLCCIFIFFPPIYSTQQMVVYCSCYPLGRSRHLINGPQVDEFLKNKNFSSLFESCIWRGADTETRCRFVTFTPVKWCAFVCVSAYKPKKAFPIDGPLFGAQTPSIDNFGNYIRNKTFFKRKKNRAPIYTCLAFLS